MYITNLRENEISVDPKVVEEMKKLRTERSLQLCYTSLYELNAFDFKLCHLNARSLHRHIEDVRNNLNYSSCDITIFTETGFSPFDDDKMYIINSFQLFRNDAMFNPMNPKETGTIPASRILKPLWRLTCRSSPVLLNDKALQHSRAFATHE